MLTANLTAKPMSARHARGTGRKLLISPATSTLGMLGRRPHPPGPDLF
jgi:hypothetical protein